MEAVADPTGPSADSGHQSGAAQQGTTPVAATMPVSGRVAHARAGQAEYSGGRSNQPWRNTSGLSTREALALKEKYAKKSIGTLEKKLQWDLNHVEELCERMRSKGKSESAWAHRKLLRVFQRIEEVTMELRRRDPELLREKKRKNDEKEGAQEREFSRVKNDAMLGRRPGFYARCTAKSMSGGSTKCVGEAKERMNLDNPKLLREENLHRKKKMKEAEREAKEKAKLLREENIRERKRMEVAETEAKDKAWIRQKNKIEEAEREAQEMAKALREKIREKETEEKKRKAEKVSKEKAKAGKAEKIAKEKAKAEKAKKVAKEKAQAPTPTRRDPRLKGDSTRGIVASVEIRHVTKGPNPDNRDNSRLEEPEGNEMRKGSSQDPRLKDDCTQSIVASVEIRHIAKGLDPDNRDNSRLEEPEGNEMPKDSSHRNVLSSGDPEDTAAGHTGPQAKPACVVDLPTACYDGDLSMVRALLETSGANKDLADEYGYTPLHLACEQGHVEVVRRLIESGANKDLADKYGETPLHIACIEGHLEVARLLIQSGANNNLADDEGQTPLHIACRNTDHKMSLLCPQVDAAAWRACMGLFKSIQV